MVFKMRDYYCAICPLQGFLCPQLVDQIIASGVLGIIWLTLSLLYLYPLQGFLYPRWLILSLPLGS